MSNKKGKSKLREEKTKIDRLPPELIDKISQYLDPDSISSLRQTSSKYLAGIDKVDMKQKVRTCALESGGIGYCHHSRCLVYILKHQELLEDRSYYQLLGDTIVYLSPENFKYVYEKLNKPYGRFRTAIIASRLDKYPFNSDNIMYLISMHPRVEEYKMISQTLIVYGDEYMARKLIKANIISIEEVLEITANSIMAGEGHYVDIENRQELFVKSIALLADMMSDYNWIYFFSKFGYDHHIIDDIYYLHNIKFTEKQLTYFMEYSPRVFCFLILDRGDNLLFRSFFLRIVAESYGFSFYRPRGIGGGTLENFLELMEELEDKEDLLMTIVDFATQKFPRYMVTETPEKIKSIALEFMINSDYYWYPKIVSELFNEELLDSGDFIAKRLDISFMVSKQEFMFHTLAEEYTFKATDFDLTYQNNPEIATFLAFYYLNNNDFREFIERHQIDKQYVVDLLDNLRMFRGLTKSGCPDKQNILDLSENTKLGFKFFNYVYGCGYDGLARDLEKRGHPDAYRYLVRFLIFRKDAEELKTIIRLGLIDIKTFIEEAEHSAYEEDLAERVIYSMKHFEVDDYFQLINFKPEFIIPAFMNLRIDRFTELMEKIGASWEAVVDFLEEYPEEYTPSQESSTILLKNYNNITPELAKQMLKTHGVEFRTTLEQYGIPNVYDLVFDVATRPDDIRNLYLEGYLNGIDILRRVVESRDINQYEDVIDIQFTEEEQEIFFDEVLNFARDNMEAVHIIDRVFNGIQEQLNFENGHNEVDFDDDEGDDIDQLLDENDPFPDDDDENNIPWQPDWF
jgi:hypothetical protein